MWRRRRGCFVVRQRPTISVLPTGHGFVFVRTVLNHPDIRRIEVTCGASKIGLLVVDLKFHQLSIDDMHDDAASSDHLLGGLQCVL